MKELNKLIKQMMGTKMTKREKALQDVLRLRVKEKAITVEQAHEIWEQLVEGSQRK